MVRSPGKQIKKLPMTRISQLTIKIAYCFFNRNFKSASTTSFKTSVSLKAPFIKQITDKNNSPETLTERDAAFKFEITNQVAFYLRSPKLRPLYDSILEKQGQLPYWKGFRYLYTRHKLACMCILAILAMSFMEYLKAWDKYLAEKLAMDQFVKNAQAMAQRMSDKHSSAKTHKSYIDLGDRTIQCEITSSKEIFVVVDGNRVPLDSVHLVQKPSLVNNITLLRLPIAYVNQKLQ
jgi:hypothetical protein